MKLSPAKSTCLAVFALAVFAVAQYKLSNNLTVDTMESWPRTWRR